MEGVIRTQLYAGLGLVNPHYKHGPRLVNHRLSLCCSTGAIWTSLPRRRTDHTGPALRRSVARPLDDTCPRTCDTDAFNPFYFSVVLRKREL